MGVTIKTPLRRQMASENSVLTIFVLRSSIVLAISIAA